MMVAKSKLSEIVICTALLFVLSVGLVAADLYTTEQTTNVTLGLDGTFTANQSDVGVSYQITGTPNATGTVTADLYGDNPQPTAAITSGISLTGFMVLTFDMNPNDFTQATITIDYTAFEVQNLNAPYAIYKYDSSSNSYVVLPSTVDTDAKTITITLNSINDPLLALGGATKTINKAVSTTTWILVAISIVIIIVATVVVIKILTPSNKPTFGAPKPKYKNRTEQKTN